MKYHVHRAARAISLNLSDHELELIGSVLGRELELRQVYRLPDDETAEQIRKMYTNIGNILGEVRG